jgi:hypothetical protein
MDDNHFHFFGGRRVDGSVLWLSFAPQKPSPVALLSFIHAPFPSVTRLLSPSFPPFDFFLWKKGMRIFSIEAETLLNQKEDCRKKEISAVFYTRRGRKKSIALVRAGLPDGLFSYQKFQFG